MKLEFFTTNKSNKADGTMRVCISVCMRLWVSMYACERVFTCVYGYMCV